MALLRDLRKKVQQVFDSTDLDERFQRGVQRNLNQARYEFNKPRNVSPQTKRALGTADYLSSQFVKGTPFATRVAKGAGFKPNITGYQPKDLPSKVAGFGAELLPSLLISGGVGNALKGTSLVKNAQRPLTQTAAKLTSPLLNTGKGSQLAGKGLLNVSQGLPYTLGYQAFANLQRASGERETGTGGDLVQDIAFDAVTGGVPLLGATLGGLNSQSLKGLTGEALDDALLNKRAFSNVKDKGLRFFISDRQANLKRGNLKNALERGFATLGEIFDHPQLYKEYPQARNLPVNFDPNMSAKGAFDEVAGKITLNPKNLNMETLGTLLHENQHFIQGVEDFARGGNVLGAKLSLFEDITGARKGSALDGGIYSVHQMDDAVSQMKDHFEGYLKKFRDGTWTSDQLRVVEEMVGTQKDIENKLKLIEDYFSKSDIDIYKRIQGEAEARAASDFRNLTQNEGKGRDLLAEQIQKEGIKPEDLIVRKGDGTSLSFDPNDTYKASDFELPFSKSKGKSKAKLPVIKDDAESLSRGTQLSGLKADQPLEKFADWVNARRASVTEGILKSREFRDLDERGIQGILDFQAGDKTGRLGDVKKYFDNKYKVLQKEGIQFNYKDDYLTQLWKEPQEEVEKVYRALSKRPGFTKEAIFKNYAEGMKAGLTPKYDRISQIVQHYEGVTNKAIADHNFFKYLIDEGMISRSQNAPRDWVTLNPDRFPKFGVKTDSGTYTGVYKAPPEMAEMINNYLGSGNFEWLEKAADWTSTVKNRVLSFGIPGTAINAHGFNILSRNVMSSKNPLEGAYTGIKYMLNPGSAQKQLDKVLEDAPAAMKNGLTLSANEFSSILEVPEGFKSQFGGVWNKLFERGLFERMLPALKLQKYEEVRQGFLKSGMGEKEAGRAAAKFTNDVFGGINWEELGKSRDMQNLLRATILAPDWLRTNINLGKNLPKSVIKFNDPSLQAYRRFLATFIGTYVTMNVVNKLTSGHFMFQNDPGNEFNIEAGYTADGQKRYIRPFGTAADFIRVPTEVFRSLANGDVSRVGRVVRNRLSIPLGVGIGVMTDTDYAGQPIGYRGTDKYGNEMPLSQRISGVGGELATLAGTPAFTKQGFDFISGKTGGEQALLQGFELPLRYSGGTRSNIAKQAQEIEPLKGKELYDRNESLRGQTKFSDNQMARIKSGETSIEGLLWGRKMNALKDVRNDYAKGNITREEAIEKINTISPTTYEGEGGGTIVNMTSFAANPVTTIKLWQKGEPIKKVSIGGDTPVEKLTNFFGAITVSERANGISGLDNGDKNTEIDHIRPKWLGGREEPENYQILTVEEHAKKTALDNKLLEQFEAGDITKEEAWEQYQAFNKTLNGKPISEDQVYALVIEAVEEPKESRSTSKTGKKTSKKTGGSKKKGVKVSVKKSKPASIKSTSTSRAKLPSVNVKAPNVTKIRARSLKTPNLNFRPKTYDPVKVKGFRNDLA